MWYGLSDTCLESHAESEPSLFMGLFSPDNSRGVSMPFTDTHIRSLKPDMRPRKCFGGGLFLFLSPPRKAGSVADIPDDEL